MRKVVLLAAVVVLAVSALSEAATWQIDADHSSVQFKVRHLLISNVKGEFSKFSGIITIDDQEIKKSRASVMIDVASINTGVAKRDAHLKSTDFFDAATYPIITFISKEVLRPGQNRLQVLGDLTIHGVTREVLLEVEGPTAEVKDPWGRFRRGATANTKINRKDFGLTWNKALESGGMLVGDDVAITLEIEMVKK